MGFKTVYQCLTDVFPQVDSRILKAVAIENAKDADAAVEIVLLEILPFLQKNPAVATPPSVGTSHTDSSDGGVEQEEETPVLRHQLSSFGKAIEFSVEPRSVVEEDSRKADLTVGIPVVSTNEGEELNPSAPIKVHENIGSEQLCRSIEREELTLLANPQNQKINDQPMSTQALEVFTNALVHGVDADPIQVCANIVTEVPAIFSESDKKVRNEHEETDTSCSLVQENRDSEWDDLFCPVADDLDMINCEKIPQVESLIDGTVPKAGDSVVEQTSGAEEAFSPDHIQGIINDCNNLKSKQDNIVDLLEEMVEDAKSNKKTLFLSMESVMRLMREVELKEEEAELAKEEAARGGVDILHQVEELKKMLVHAKEANDMRAGEVYGEKAILATELRELQARLLSLSDERDNALAILDEMHQTIQERLSAAEEMRKVAELEKLEKEESARNALAEQEVIMEKVVQESKMLQREAEENSKLQEFLMDRGRVVDMLQGEISVICQDVRLLKEKFDERVPLSKSISSSQTSCILASSGSSLKSTPFELNLEVVEISKSSKEASSASSVASVDNDDDSPKGKPEQQRIISRDSHPLDDGWEFFESAEM